ncbi:MAG TPA: alanine racemase [Thermoanaerobaculia bacterium]|nr:alanine racemase [Thermoanaerobaculia bacterium]
MVAPDAIAANYRLLRERVAPRAVYAVVKADAYGHGAPAVARRLSAEGADRFAVAQADEGVSLRRAGVAGEILVLSHADARDLPRLRGYALTPALYDLGQAAAFARATATLADALPVHLELDTGMGRAGLRPEQLDEAASLLRAARGLAVVGTFANLSSADDRASPATERQAALLREGAARLKAAGILPGLVHAANSAAILASPGAWLDAVRPGLALYGVAPSADPWPAALTPALSVETEVVSVRQVPAGTPLGYGGRFVTTRATTIAVLPIGYADGFRRSLSGKASVLLRGRRAPVVGTVSMDVTLVDATETGAGRGDPVVCLGAQGSESIGAWELARAADTIPYEILCGLGARVRREYAGS